MLKISDTPLTFLFMKSSRNSPKGKKFSLSSLQKNWPYAQLEISLHYDAATVMATPFTDANIAYDYFLKIWDMGTIDIQEDTVALFLDHQNKLIGHRRLLRGSAHSSLISRKMICAIGLLSLASGVILAHNRPSRTLEPSNADQRATNTLSYALDLLDIKLLDHLIITKDGYTNVPFLAQQTESGLYKQLCGSPFLIY